MIKISNLRYTEVFHIHGSTIISMIWRSKVEVRMVIFIWDFSNDGREEETLLLWTLQNGIV